MRWLKVKQKEVKLLLNFNFIKVILMFYPLFEMNVCNDQSSLRGQSNELLFQFNQDVTSSEKHGIQVLIAKRRIQDLQMALPGETLDFRQQV